MKVDEGEHLHGAAPSSELCKARDRCNHSDTPSAMPRLTSTRILASLPEDCCPGMRQLVKVASPLLTLEELSSASDIPLEQASERYKGVEGGLQNHGIIRICTVGKL